MPITYKTKYKFQFENMNFTESFITKKFKERRFLNGLSVLKILLVTKFIAINLMFKKLSKILIISISYFQVLSFFKQILNKFAGRFEIAIGNIVDLITFLSFNKFMLAAGTNKILRPHFAELNCFPALLFTFNFLPSIYNVSYFENFLENLYADLNFRFSLVLSNFLGDFLVKLL